ncbi:MAG: hypothetical protein REI09_03180 [Candidatus Dactylopiibacterium sp.]|nr:hypothetical protein [Candidatus Dactylopiibacterium sp.]
MKLRAPLGLITAFMLLALLGSGEVAAREPRPREAREDARPRREAPSREAPREMRRDDLREQLRQNDARRGPRGRGEDDAPSLRRLDPEERERLRRTMRDAAREHYRP